MSILNSRYRGTVVVEMLILLSRYRGIVAIQGNYPQKCCHSAMVERSDFAFRVFFVCVLCKLYSVEVQKPGELFW